MPKFKVGDVIDCIRKGGNKGVIVVKVTPTNYYLKIPYWKKPNNYRFAEIDRDYILAYDRWFKEDLENILK